MDHIGSDGVGCCNGLQLNGLKKRALLEEVGDGTTQIGMHDLWEFVVKETNRGEQDRRSWVYEAVESEGEDSCLTGGGWKQLLRICIMKEGRSVSRRSVQCLEFSDCSNVTVLRLVSRCGVPRAGLEPIETFEELGDCSCSIFCANRFGSESERD